MKKTLPVIAILAAVLGLATAPARAATASAETLQNLQTAFTGESNAAHRYAQFATKADQEGHAQVAKLFRAASKAEQIHRDRHKAAIEKLGGKAAPVTLDPVTAGTTAENLEASIRGESYERDTMYPDFIARAKAEDTREAVRTLQAARSAEKEHARLYQQALAELGTNSAADYYVCPSCGFTVTSRPGKECPVCREDPDKYLKIS